MEWFRSGKLRVLYVLALVQLVGGPLILLHISMFCSLTLREVPRVGVAKAAIQVWNSDGFQALLSADEVLPAKAAVPIPGGDGSPAESLKQPPIPWLDSWPPVSLVEAQGQRVEWSRAWTPGWPQAPPAPPPRCVGLTV
jgi:hypothetical protein